MGLYLIAEVSFWANPAWYWGMFMMALGLGTVIFVHELGHFLVAKSCGVKCEKFYVGFDFFDIKIAGRVIIPRSLIRVQWGETEYGIGIIPLGGYVKMLGQDDNPTGQAQEFERLKEGAKEGEAETSDSESATDSDQTESADDQSNESESTSDATASPDKSAAIRSAPTVAESAEVLDPRNYQNKAVWQRMLIISAGVIMNLIFAVIFATIAFRVSISFTPCEVGGTVAGSEAWIKAIPPGYRIVSLDDKGEPRWYIRFVWDLAQSVAANGDKKEMTLQFEPAGGGKIETIPLRRTHNLYHDDDFPSLGIHPAGTTKLGAEGAVLPHSAAAKADKPLQPKDRIVAVNDKQIDNIYELKKFLAQHAEDPVNLTVERIVTEKGSDGKQSERVKTNIPPNPIRHLGLWMTMGPILAIQDGSPAKEAGFKVGDLLKSVAGDPIENPLALSQRVRKLAGESIAVTVLRDGKVQQLKVVPRQPTVPSDVRPGRPIAINELGIAFPIMNVVEHVEGGSPADKAGLKSGDIIESVEFVPASKAKKQEEEDLRLSHKLVDLTKRDKDWPSIHERIQYNLPDTKVKIGFKRGNEVKTAELLPVASQEWFNQSRGFLLQPKQNTFTAKSWGEAFYFGRRQTWEDATRVLGFLRKLVSGGISPTHLGGPLTIGMVATTEAMQGPSRLLIFLTFLSANLAVVNFLPIPVLDGGHMLFLTWEGVTGRKPSEKVFVSLSIAGLAFLLSLMIFVIGLDVFRFAADFSSG